MYRYHRMEKVFQSYRNSLLSDKQFYIKLAEAKRTMIYHIYSIYMLNVHQLMVYENNVCVNNTFKRSIDYSWHL